MRRGVVLVGVATAGVCAVACRDAGPGEVAVHEVERAPVALRAAPARPLARVSVAAVDVSSGLPPASRLPVEGRFLLLSADGSEPGLAAIRAALDYRGTPYDVLVAADEPALTRERLSAGDLGFYQAIVLATASLPLGEGSALS